MALIIEHIIIYRNNGKVGFISDDDDNATVFLNKDSAQKFALTSKFLNAVNYQMVELDI